MRSVGKKQLTECAAYAFLALVFLLPFSDPDGSGSDAWRILSNLGHLPVFGAIAAWLCVRFKADGWGKPYLAAFAATAATAAVIELVQPWFGRTAGLSDWLTGSVGALIVVTGLYVWVELPKSAVRWMHAVVAPVLSAGVLLSPLHEAWAIWWRWHAFPLLGDFEAVAERSIWLSYPPHELDETESRCTGRASRGEHSLTIRTVPRSYSGVEYRAGDMSWRAFRVLAFDVYVQDPSLPLIVRIDDDGNTGQYDYRFNRRLLLNSGWNHIGILLDDVERGPKRRRLNLNAIRRVVFFTGPGEFRSQVLCLDNVRLL